MKKYGVSVVPAVLFLLAFLGLAQAAQVVDRIVAVVNGEIITFQDL